MTTLAEFTTLLRRKMDDDPADPDNYQYPDALVADGLNAALGAILPWFPQELTEDLSGDGVETVFPITNARKIQAVMDTTQKVFLGALMLDEQYHVDVNRNDWMEYPVGTVRLVTPPGSSTTLRVFYETAWDMLTDDADELPVPDYLLHPLLLYAKAYCIERAATETADVRRWASRAHDAGTPSNNPLEDHVKFLLRLFEIEMERVPKRSNRG